MIVSTEGGVITAEESSDQNFPSIDIRIAGNLAVIVEWDSLKKQFRVHNYMENEDEPESRDFDLKKCES